MSNNGFLDMDDTADGDLPSTGVGVVRVGKRDYAVGLIWNEVDDPVNAVSEARGKASKSSFNADYFCIQQGGTPQFGLGAKAQKHRSGMPSLAAHCAQSKGGSWLGIFEVRDGYYLIGITNDAILSECDRFFESEDDAKVTFEYFQNMADWQELYAPKGMAIPGTSTTELEVLLDGKPTAKLQDVSRSRSIIMLVLALIGIGGMIVGVMFYMDKLEELANQQRLQDIADQAKSKITPEAEVPPPPPPPWSSQFMGYHIIENCVKEVSQFPTDIPGWNVSELVCKGNNVAARIDRTLPLPAGGSFNWIEIMVKKEGKDYGFFPDPNGSGSTASVQWSMGDLPKIPLDIETEKLTSMKKALLSTFEERLVPIVFGDAPDNNDHYRGFTFRFSTTADPRNFIDIISVLPGSMITSMAYNVEMNTWSTEGRVYEQLPIQKVN